MFLGKLRAHQSPLQTMLRFTAGDLNPPIERAMGARSTSPLLPDFTSSKAVTKASLNTNQNEDGDLLWGQNLLTGKGNKKSFWQLRNLYLDLNGSYTSACMCKNTSVELLNVLFFLGFTEICQNSVAYNKSSADEVKQCYQTLISQIPVP